MAELDFTALNRLTYKDFETAEEQEKKDALIANGWTIVDDKDNPFLQASEMASEPPQAFTLIEPYTVPQKTSQGKIETFKDASGTRNYKMLYRAAQDFHKRHSPPILDREYWRTHTAGEDDVPQAELDYWEEAANDLCATSNAFSNDPFLINLLVAIFNEIEREYQNLRGHNKGTSKA